MATVLEGRRPGGYTRTLPSRIRSLDQLKHSFDFICLHLARSELYAVATETSQEIWELREAIFDELRCLRQELVALRGDLTEALVTHRRTLHRAVLAASVMTSLFIPTKVPYPNRQVVSSVVTPLSAELVGFLTALCEGEEDDVTTPDAAASKSISSTSNSTATTSSSLYRALSGHIVDPGRRTNKQHQGGVPLPLSELAPQLLMLVFAFFNQLASVNQWFTRITEGAPVAAELDSSSTSGDGRNLFLEATLLVVSGDIVGIHALLQECKAFGVEALADSRASSAVVSHALQIPGASTLTTHDFHYALLAQTLQCGLSLQRTSLQYKEFLRGIGASFRPKPAETDPPLPNSLMKYLGIGAGDV